MKKLIILVSSLIVVALVLPIALVNLTPFSTNGVKAINLIDGGVLIILLTTLLPILIVIGGIMMSMSRSEVKTSICTYCIWFLRDLTCEKGLEIDCISCEGGETNES